MNHQYPARHLLIIPIEGGSTLSLAGPLPIDTYCYIDYDPENPPKLSGEDIDVIVVAYEIKREDA